jgi:HK97 family phage major capsid protein/HK97 family phage prohead protease
MPGEIEPITGPPAKLPVSVCRSQADIGQLRSEGGGMPVMDGHFSVFDGWYEINSSFEGHFMERVAPGAFRKTFKDDSGRKNAGDRIKVLLEHGHDPTVADKPLGVPRALEEDGQGARYEVPLLDTSYVRDLVPALEAGAYGSSFRFRVLHDDWDEAPERSDYNPDGIPERTIREVRVMEFGPTMYPANAGATAGIRSTTDEYYAGLKRRQPEAYEEALRSAQETREQAEQARAQAVAERAAQERTEAVAAIVAAGFTTEQVDAIVARMGQDPVDPETVISELQRQQAEKQGGAITYHDPQDQGTPAAGAASTPEGAAPSRTGEPRTHSTDIGSGSGTGRTQDMPVENQPAGGTGGELTMTVEEREERQSAIQRRLGELDAEYNGAALPQERQTEWEQLSAEYDEHTGHIQAAVARQQRIAALAGSGSTERGTGFQAPSVQRRPENIYDLTAIRRDARSMDDMIRMQRDNALRAIEQHHYDNAPDQDAVRARIEHLLRTTDLKEGDLARRILVTGTEIYDRAFGKACLALNTHGLTNEERAALAVGTTTAGGFAVPFSLDPTVIMTNNSVVNPVRSVARVVTITGKQWQGITSAGITVARAAEAAEASDNAPTIAQPTATPTRVQGFVPFSFEVDQDWTQMRSELGMMFDEAKDVEEATSFTTGTGVDPNPEGFITGIRANAGSIVGLTTPGSLVVADLYKPVNALPPRHVANASWMGNKGMYNLVRQLDTAGGANLWARLAEGRPARLIDYPLAEASAMANGSDLTTANTSLLVLGDFKKFLIVDRVGMSVELIPHLFGSSNRFPTGQRGLYAVWRNTSKVLDPNAFRLLETS